MQAFGATPAPNVNIGSVISGENAVETVIATQGVFVDFNLNALAVAGSNIALWSLSDSTTGELTYNGLSPFTGSLTASISASSMGGANEFHFRAVKNGAPLSDAVLAGRQIANTIGSITLIAPITVDPGDTIRLQVENDDGTSNITIHEMSANIS
jgi:hypothetical protein